MNLPRSRPTSGPTPTRTMQQEINDRRANLVETSDGNLDSFERAVRRQEQERLHALDADELIEVRAELESVRADRDRLAAAIRRVVLAALSAPEEGSNDV